MNKKDTLGDRMKTYENVNRTYLTRRTPAIIRLDMRAGHTFTKGFEKPFDKIFMECMQETMKYLCKNIQGCKLGYTQSDEISLLLTDYDDINTAAWFDYGVQKMASISASMATLHFNRIFHARSYDWFNRIFNDDAPADCSEQQKVHMKAADKGATFDSRVFNLPKDEVTNYFLWRQNDATWNSIQSVGQSQFSRSELHKKSCNDIQDMLVLQRGINWNDFSTTEKRGCCCIKKDIGWTHMQWIIDSDIPIFKGEGREYIEIIVEQNS